MTAKWGTELMPALYVDAKGAWLKEDGQISPILNERALKVLEQYDEVLLCNAALTLNLLGREHAVHENLYDILSLFAFVRPTAFCVPSALGLCEALNLAKSHVNILEDGWQVSFYDRAVRLLLTELHEQNQQDALDIAHFMGQHGWLWAPLILENSKEHTKNNPPKKALEQWHHLPRWTALGEKKNALNIAIPKEKGQEKLRQILKNTAREQRQGQDLYLQEVSKAFGLYDSESGPHVVVAEGETGVGKTLGYLTPAILWAHENDAPVWISTYSRYLQNQIEAEYHRSFTDDIGAPQEDSQKPSQDVAVRDIVVRQGRENYICLLNFEDALSDLAHTADRAITLGYVARWIGKTKTGNLLHGDFPTWLASIEKGRASFEELTDKRNQCIYRACPHYHQCFIEREQRLSEQAKIVISNHALSLIRLSYLHESSLTGENEVMKMIWDEAHHLFRVADDVFSVSLGIKELAYLRYWVLGRERAKGKLNQGLRKRLPYALSADAHIAEFVALLEEYSEELPTHFTLQQVMSHKTYSNIESFFFHLYNLVQRLGNEQDNHYSQEILVQDFFQLRHDIFPPSLQELRTALRNEAQALLSCMENLSGACLRLAESLKTLKENQTAMMENDLLRSEITSCIRSIEAVILPHYENYRLLLEDLLSEEDAASQNYIDRALIERNNGEVKDIAIVRNFLEPSKMLTQILHAHSSGLVFTSATLKNKRIEHPHEGWQETIKRIGLHYWPQSEKQMISYSSVLSPFRWAEHTKIFLIKDIDKRQIKNIEFAFAQLMNASGGGALGLFTALGRLKKVAPGLRAYLASKGMNLYVQHMDGMATSDLARIFSGDENSCLIGSDALRDGLDVVGQSLRLVIFERLPWPRPDILHKKRREIFGKKQYDTNEMGWRLRQAYGRLLRHENDKGIMVILDDYIPSQALASFPPDIKPERLSLAEAKVKIRDFLL